MKIMLTMSQPAAFVKKKRLIPRPVRWIPTKHQGAYDEVGKIPGSGGTSWTLVVLIECGIFSVERSRVTV